MERLQVELLLVGEGLYICLGKVLLVGVGGLVGDFGLLPGVVLLAAAVEDEEVDLVDEDEHADDQAEHDGAHLDVDGRVDLGDGRGGCATHHGAVVHGHEEADELCEVADVGAVVVVGLRVGQVHQVVQQEGDRQPHYDQRRHRVLVRARNVQADPAPVQDGHHEVQSFHQPRLELLLVLSEPVVFCTHEGERHEEGQGEGEDGSDGGGRVEGVVLGGVVEVEAGGVGEVEAVEEDEGEQHLLDDPLGDRMQAGRAGLTQPGAYEEYQRNHYNCHHDHEHDVAVAQEVGLVADGLHAGGSVGGLQAAGLAALLTEVHGEAVDSLQAHEGSHQGVDGVHISHVDVCQLQYSEEFQSHDLAGQCRGDQRPVAGVFHCFRQLLHVLLGLAGGFVVVEELHVVGGGHDDVDHDNGDGGGLGEAECCGGEVEGDGFLADAEGVGEGVGDDSAGVGPLLVGESALAGVGEHFLEVGGVVAGVDWLDIEADVELVAGGSTRHDRLEGDEVVYVHAAFAGLPRTVVVTPVPAHQVAIVARLAACDHSVPADRLRANPGEQVVVDYAGLAGDIEGDCCVL